MKEVTLTKSGQCNVASPLRYAPRCLQVKLDLKPFVERHSFSFDDALDENVTNDQVLPPHPENGSGTISTKQG